MKLIRFRFSKMPSVANTVLLTFPARSPTDGEREILRGWLGTTEEFTAFVSERRGDDPAIFRKIVISRRATKQRLYFVHAPLGSDVWIVVSATEGEDIERFPTLRAALRFVTSTTA